MAHTVLDPHLDYRYSLIGIASDQPAWKLCWALNQLLSINLKQAETEPIAVIEPSESLFAEAKDEWVWPTLFEDMEQEGKFEVQLKEMPNSAPKEAKPFNYVLIVRSTFKENPCQDWVEILKQQPLIQSAVLLPEKKYRQLWNF